MLETALWIAQTFVALFFLAAGAPKVLGRGIDRWVGFDDLPRPLVVLIGICEVTAALALVVPLVTGNGGWTTPLAAGGLVTVSLMASGFHVRVGEWLPAVETALWACLAVTIAIGRWNQLDSVLPIPRDVLVAPIVVLVPTIILNLVILFRQPVPPEGTSQRQPSTQQRR